MFEYTISLSDEETNHTGTLVMLQSTPVSDIRVYVGNTVMVLDVTPEIIKLLLFSEFINPDKIITLFTEYPAEIKFVLPENTTEIVFELALILTAYPL